MSRILSMCFAVLFVVSTFSTGFCAEKTRLLLGSASSASSHYGYWVSVSQVINSKVPSLESTTAETGAAVDNLRRISRGQIDLGLVTTNAVYQAYHGQGQWKDKPIKTRILWAYAFSPQIIAVREDSGIKTIKDLEGKKIHPGGKGTSTEVTSEAVMKAFGVTPDWSRGATTNMVDAIKDNRMDGYIKSGNGDKVDASTKDIMTSTKLSCIGITPEQEEIITKQFPELTLMRLEEASPGIPPFTTWAFGNVGAGRMDMPDEVAYQITKAVCEDKVIQAEAFSGVRGLDFVEQTMKFANVPLHPGAIRYYREIGANIPAHLIP